jgi:hypothetical protein
MRAGAETRPYERNSNISVCRGGPLCPPEKVGRLASGYTLSGHTTDTRPYDMKETSQHVGATCGCPKCKAKKAGVQRTLLQYERIFTTRRGGPLCPPIIKAGVQRTPLRI